MKWREKQPAWVLISCNVVNFYHEEHEGHEDKEGREFGDLLN